MYANVFCHICNEPLFIREFLCNKYAEVYIEKSILSDGRFTALIDNNFITGRGDANNDRKHVLPTVCFVIEVKQKY
jgi:hypothetical protein